MISFYKVACKQAFILRTDEKRNALPGSSGGEMLQLKEITKTYKTEGYTQDALKGVSVNFRDNEFVSILGHSGSGKTTLLNIVGGLDRYTSGDLIINGVSTKKYKDSDWDLYRNKSIGFIFQSYNLIPHQSVLANVEMALTIAGVSKKERHERAKEALKTVGLEEHMHKRPNQLSGGQMQRVAIARALINDPDILLADEPTGALDSETSVQVMNLLKEIAKDKLVIMVTHNPELANEYSTRIINLVDGQITGDSDPYNECDEEKERGKVKKISMSFATALSLSFSNLRTKKGRTILTAFAGSIGIIGIALILSLSTGTNQYITDIQKSTLTSYPIEIDASTYDLTSLMEIAGESSPLLSVTEEGQEEEASGIVVDFSMMETSESVTTSVIENNLTDFKAYLDDPDSDIQEYLGENGVVYSYDISFSVYSYDSDGNLVDSDMDVESDSDSTSMFTSIMNSMLSVVSSDSTGDNFSVLTADSTGEGISSVVTDSYDLVYGSWPSEYDEVVLVLDESNSIEAEYLCQLGLITKDEYDEQAQVIEDGGSADEIVLDFDEVLEHTFYLVPACDNYEENENGTWSLIEDTEDLIDGAIELKIVGVIKPSEDAQNADIYTAVAYSSALTYYIMDYTAESDIVIQQMDDEETNVLSGVAFDADDDEEKVEIVKEYLSELSTEDKASMYQLIMYLSTASDEEDEDSGDAEDSDDSGDSSSSGEIDSDTISSAEDASSAYSSDALAAMALAGGTGSSVDDETYAALLDAYLEDDPDEELMVEMYDEYVGGSSYEDNMEAFGYINEDTPSSIAIYCDTYEDKDMVAECIENYNASADEDSQITYTDYVALLTSSMTTIINAITYVLIAFVAISLVVSCIMIGIITNISVMERTKEIGILRALGASKKNVSHIFNAETFIIGICSGVLGVGISLLCTIPINAIIRALTGIEGLKAQLTPRAVIILVVISILITMIGGLIPSRKASKQDPAVALRTE